jgi:gas vesicle protein
MVDDLTKIGLLVSKKMPARTNETGEPRHNNGLVYFIVAPQYMPAIYTALREVVIYKHKQDQFIQTREQELMKMEFISKGLAKWITGNEFQKMGTTLMQIHGHTEETISDCQKSIVAVTKNAKKAIQRQETIQTEILNTEGFLESLADILSPNTKTTKEERE